MNDETPDFNVLTAYIETDSCPACGLMYGLEIERNCGIGDCPIALDADYTNYHEEE